MPRRPSRLVLLASLALGALGLVAACGDDGGASSSAGGGAGAGLPSGGTGGGTPGSGGGGDGAGGTAPVPCEETGTCDDERSFCDPATWGGSVPTAGTDVVLPDGRVVVDCDAEARSIEIRAGATLAVSRRVSTTLTLHGNLVVRGVLDWGTPEDRVPADVTAEIVFTGMDDADYVGTPSVIDESIEGHLETPMEVLESDVGMWIVDGGRFTAAGAEKRSWSFLTDGAGPGDPSLEVEDATGWRPGDRIVLTPTATHDVPEHDAQFDEGVVASVDGRAVSLEAAPGFEHAGCTSCVRRGEAANLTRNVVVRSADDTAHAHVMVAHEGVLQLDAVELRWLGPVQPCTGGAPERRAPIWFHQQHDAAADSFVRHVSIWGGDNHFLMQEMSHGVEVVDVAGYDTFGTGFSLFYDSSNCGTRCGEESRTNASRGTVFTDVLAAKVGVHERESGCARISHRHAGIVVSGGEGSGCRGCVATGVGHVGSGNDLSGFVWAEGGSGRPDDFTFDDNVSHDNGGHGALIWHNGSEPQPTYDRNRFWSNAGYGIHWGAYNNAFVLKDFTAIDNGLESVGVKAVPRDDRPRLDGATIDDLIILAYVQVQERPNLLRGLTFTGDRPVGISSLHQTCTEGDENDPEDPDCLRVWLRIEDPVFPSGMIPFDVGVTFNRHTLWEVRGFEHPDYPDLPENFDLHRADNEVEGGFYHADFDAWLVPRD